MNLTANEVAVMKSLANNNYDGGVWSWAVDDSSTPSGLPKTSIPGVVGSLVKKGLVTSEEYERNEYVIWFTDKGEALIEELNLRQ